MYAIVEIAGQQMKVQEGQELYVNRLDADKGDDLSFNQVLLTDRDGEVSIGTPTTGNTVKATVLDQVKGDMVIVFKKKRRKGHRVKKGHRQMYSKIRIDEIA